MTYEVVARLTQYSKIDMPPEAKIVEATLVFRPGDTRPEWRITYLIPVES